MKRELPSPNEKINSKNRPKMKTNANKKKVREEKGRNVTLWNMDLGSWRGRGGGWEEVGYEGSPETES